MKQRSLLVIVSLLIAYVTNPGPTVRAQATLRMALSAPVSPISVHNLYGPVHYGETFGIKVTADDYTTYSTGATAAQAMLAGQADILNTAVTTVFALRESGPDVKVFCPSGGLADYVVVGRNGIKTLEQVLDPKTRVVSDSPTGIATSILNGLFQVHGLNGKVMELPNLQLMGDPQLRLTAWVSNTADVTMIRLSQFRQASKDVPDGVIIAKIYEELPNFLFSTWSAPAEWLDKNQDTAAAFCASILLGATKLTSDFDLYISGVKEFIAKPPPDTALKETFELAAKYDFWQLKSAITAESVTFMGNLALKGGGVKALPDPKDVLDTRPYEKALKLLETVNRPATPDASATAEATMAATAAQ